MISFDQSDNDQLIITPELLALLQHITHNYLGELKQLVEQAYQTYPRQNAEILRNSDIAQAQTHIIEFLGLMELLLYEVTREREFSARMHNHLMPSIQHIDTSQVHNEVVEASVEHATGKIKQHPHNNPQEILYKELLKRWKPAKETVQN